MALIQCKRHGDSNVAFVSLPIANAVVANVPSFELVTQRILIDVGTGTPSVHVVDAKTLDEFCRNHLVSRETLRAVSEDASIEVFSHLRGVCTNCLREWLLHNQAY